MGKRNSSSTRVVPVFDALFQGDPTGESWLEQLLRLGSFSSMALPAILDAGRLRYNHPTWWGRSERRIPPPMSLLRWLVQNATPPAKGRKWGSDSVRAKRKALVRGDAEAVRVALTELDKGYRSRAWYVLEGESSPDACVETDRILLVVEGKRTERQATSVTTWMGNRSQMLRHMDAAFDIAGRRRVLGLEIVEGPGDADAEIPSAYWLDEAKKLRSDKVLAASLPHRDVAVRGQLRDGFLGVTSWQRVCRTFCIPWPPVADAP